MRTEPGVSNPIVLELDPMADDLVAAGTTVDNGSSLWILVDQTGTEGWVNLSYVAYEGGSDDVTAIAVDRLGTTPNAVTMEELGMLVAGAFSSTEPMSKVVMANAPTPDVSADRCLRRDRTG